MKGIRSIAAAALLFLSAPLFAAERDQLLDHMTGRWVLRGTIAGRQTTHDIRAKWVLQDRYVSFTEVSREKDASGKPQYEAIVLLGYDVAKSRYVCFWYDITGVASPDAGGIAQRDGNTLPFVFKSDQGDFHTTFVYRAGTDAWTWTMDMEQGGRLDPFARVTLTRR